jgi:hypothetical protein
MKMKFDGYTSDTWIPINNEIGQGDPLLMILYIIYNTNLLEISRGKEKTEKIQAFVDDTMFLAIGKDFDETHSTLQDMMERKEGGYEWAKNHNSKFETSKFTLMDLCSQAKKEQPSMTLRGITLKPTPHHKFLGVIVDQTLRWNAQVTHAIAKGTAYAIQLKHLSSSSMGIPMSLMRQLYTAVAVPKMLYTIDVWFRPIYTSSTDIMQPGSKGAARKLESVQRIALLSITGAMHTSPTDLLEILSNIWPISHHIQNLCQQAAIRLSARPTSHPLYTLYDELPKCS